VTGPLVIYDGDCAFCQRCIDLGARLPMKVRSAPYQLLDPAVYGLTPAEVGSAAWWVGADGSRRRGHRAVAAVLAAQPRWAWRAVGRLIEHAPLSWLAAPTYALVARFRHRLPGGTAQCRPRSEFG
jgi:predicted DCC family thiol-disulfide oxidoreductase YuxK